VSKQILLSALIAVAAAFLPQAGTASGAASGGGQIVFGTLHAGEDEIWVMNADGTNKHNLTRHDGAKISDVNPRFSPDGRQIAYSSDPGGDREIWVMNADGSGAHQLTKLPRANLSSWTADGKAIVFQSANSGDSEIYRINADGSGLTNLTNDPAATDWSPAASPRGNKIVFTSDRDGNGHLYVLDADGTLTRITNGPGYDYFADWSPRGNEIAFSRDDGSGGTDLYLVHSDGSGERRLTNTPDVLEYFPAFSPETSPARDEPRHSSIAATSVASPGHPSSSSSIARLCSSSIRGCAWERRKKPARRGHWELLSTRISNSVIGPSTPASLVPATRLPA
jgi:Tol biopolymer transport system component